MTEFPLTFNQEKRLLFEVAEREDGREPEPFNVALGLNLVGHLDEAGLESALNRVIDRHAGLRAAIVESETLSKRERRIRINEFARAALSTSGLYMQIIRNTPPVRIKRIDIENSGSCGQEYEIQKLYEEELAAPFDYESPPPLRAYLLRLGKQDHLLMLVTTHLMVDLWSLNILERELKAFYESTVTGCAPGVSALDSHFPDFALHQRQSADTVKFKQSISYWRKQWVALADGQVWLSDLPAACVPPSLAEGRTACSLTVDTDRSGRFLNAARRLRMTPNILALSAFLLLLREYTHRSTVAVWMNFLNRSSSATQNMIGWFVNTHIVGTITDDQPAAPEFLGRVRAAVLDATTHEAVPRGLLWRGAEAGPRLSNVMVMFDGDLTAAVTERVSKTAGGLTIQRATLPGTAKWARGLQVRARNAGGRVVLSANYASDIFSPQTVEGMLKRLETILCGLSGGE